jgi:uncharacterized small protein (DUF1192 family)
MGIGRYIGGRIGRGKWISGRAGADTPDGHKKAEAAMVHDDEAQPRKVASWAVGEDLSTLSIDELEARIEALKAEIERVEAAIGAKRESKGIADTFFKS